MKIKVLASTKVGYELPKDEAIIFSGHAAGICYMPDSLEVLFSEPTNKTLNRTTGNLESGHHSVFGHPYYSLSFENIPKILAMLLNNEKVYNTSEKSGRYTVMQTSETEETLYQKWIKIFTSRITELYPNFDEKRVKKLALENARYLISVFTPATIMEYTVSLQQLNYIINWSKDYIENAANDSFSIKLKAVLREFLSELPDLEIPGLDSSMKNRGFSLFANRIRAEEFGENYSVNYLTSFTGLAQAMRHRTLSYEMMLYKDPVLNQPVFYVPPIIQQTKFEYMWLEDISSLADMYPQGMLVNVNERGTIENFILKCTERLCGCAQLEIMQQTTETLNRYALNLQDKYPELHAYLLPYLKGPRCTFPNWKCNKPCIFGPKDALNRII